MYFNSFCISIINYGLLAFFNKKVRMYIDNEVQYHRLFLSSIDINISNSQSRNLMDTIRRFLESGIMNLETYKIIRFYCKRSL